MPDINSYAINLAFNIDTSAAYQKLAKIGDIVSTVDDQIKKVAKSMVTDMANAVNKLLKSFELINVEQDKFSKSVDELLPNLERSAKLYNDTLESYKKINKQLEDQAKSNESFTDELLKQGDLQVDANELLDEFADDSGEVAGIWSEASEYFGDIVKNIASMTFGMDGLRNAWNTMLEETTGFEKAIYRVHGSQHALVLAVGRVAKEYGVLRSQAYEAMKVAGQITRDPTKINELAGKIAQFNQVTGVSIQLTGDWYRSLVMAGYNIAEAERRMVGYINMMRMAGATTEELQSMIQRQIDFTMMKEFMYGADGAVEAVDKAIEAFTMLGRAAGGNADKWNEMANAIATNGQAMMQLEAISGIYTAGMTEAERANAILTDGLIGLYNHFSSVAGSMDEIYVKGSTANIYFEQMAQQLGINKDVLGQYLLKVEQQRKALGLETMTYDQLEKALEKQMAKEKEAMALGAEYAESTDNLSKKFTLMKDSAKTAWMHLVIVITPLIIKIVEAITALVNKFEELMAVLDEGSKAIERVGGWVKWLSDTFGALGVAVGVIIAVSTVLALLSAAIVGLASVGYGLYAFLRLLANAIRSIPVMQLLGLAAAILIFAAAIWVLSDALVRIASIDSDKLWASMAAFGVIVAIVVAGIVALALASGALAPAAIPALAFAAVILILAGAVWVVAKAIEVLVGCVKELVKMGAEDIVMAGAAFAAFGVAIAVAGATLLVGALALGIGAALLLASNVALNIAIWTISLDRLTKYSAAMKTLSEAIKSFVSMDVSSLVNLTQIVSEFAYGMRNAGKNLVSAAEDLDEASPLITNGLKLFADGIKVIDAAAVKATSTALSGFAAAMITLSGIAPAISMFGDAIYNLGEAVSVGGSMMLGGAAAYVVASSILLSGSAILSVALSLVPEDLALSFAGVIVAIASSIQSFNSVDWGGFVTSYMILINGVLVLNMVGVLLNAAAVTLGSGATGILFAVGALSLAVLAINRAASILDTNKMSSFYKAIVLFDNAVRRINKFKDSSADFSNTIMSIVRALVSMHSMFPTTTKYAIGDEFIDFGNAVEAGLDKLEQQINRAEKIIPKIRGMSSIKVDAEPREQTVSASTISRITVGTVESDEVASRENNKINLSSAQLRTLIDILTVLKDTKEKAKDAGIQPDTHYGRDRSTSRSDASRVVDNLIP